MAKPFLNLTRRLLDLIPASLAKYLPFFWPNKFFATFSKTLNEDDDEWEGYCLVQRIEPVRLFLSGVSIKVTLRGASQGNDDAHIDRIYISRPKQATSAEPNPEVYASGGDLTPIATVPFTVPMNSSVTLPALVTHILDYDLDETQPLLIAVDFSDTPPSAIGCTKDVPVDQACAYYNTGAWAATKDRTGFTQYPGIYLIEKIEISESLGLTLPKP
jgi:hypothetical protein